MTKFACKRPIVCILAQVLYFARLLKNFLRDQVLVRLFVRRMETVVLADAPLLNVHFLVVAVLKVKSVKFVDHVLTYSHFGLLLLWQQFSVILKIDVCLKTPFIRIEGFLAAHRVVRVEFIEGVRVQLISAIHQERSERLLR